MKLFDSEWKVMEVLWQEGELPAREVALKLGETVGWNKNTTYTVIKKCVEKGAIERREPGFVCRALVSQDEARKNEAEALVERVFGGSTELLFASFLNGKKLSAEESERLHKLIEEQSE